MYCRNCGHEIQNINTACSYCGKLPLNEKNYCQECGFPTTENQLVCSSCQERLKFAQISDKPRYEQPTYYERYHHGHNAKRSDDVPNTVANIASCCSIAFTGFPIVGLILYLIWKDEKPNAAKSVCMWSLIPFIGLVLIYIILFMLGFLPRFIHHFLN